MFEVIRSVYTARKAIFSFSRRPEKMVFPKKSCWNMIFLVLSGKIMFPFPKNVIFHLRRKMKDDLPQKKYTEIWYFLQTFWKDELFKKGRDRSFKKGHDLSCIIWKDGIFSPGNMTFFPWAGSDRWPFSRNTWRYNIFCVHPKDDWRSRFTS